MKIFLSSLFGCFAAVLLAGVPKSRYQVIIDCEPFGKMAPLVEVAPEPEPSQDPVRVKEESSKIQLCAMTFTPDGRVAVGLVDNGVQPAAYITLFDGDVSNGLTMLVSDLEEEFATFERDGVRFTLKLGLGLIETITPELLAERRAAEEVAVEEEKERKRKRPNSLAEQLIAMQMSLPPDIEAPPLPIPPDEDVEAFTRKFDPDKVEGEPQTETEAIIKAGTAELEEAAALGERPQDYLRRLVKHRQQEVERQQEEKKRAQEALDEALASGSYSEEEAQALRRETNIELMKRGVVPLSPVEDLSEEEQEEINAALDAGYEG